MHESNPLHRRAEAQIGDPLNFRGTAIHRSSPDHNLGLVKSTRPSYPSKLRAMLDSVCGSSSTNLEHSCQFGCIDTGGRQVGICCRPIASKLQGKIACMQPP